jgi:ASC-1-like (ASCH) protein
MNTIYMHLNEEPFRRIEAGEKKIECRVNDEKRQRLQVGDTIVFTRRDSEPVEKLTRTIVALHKYHDFEALFADFPEERGDGTWPSKYYSEEEIKKYGVVGIEIK